MLVWCERKAIRKLSEEELRLFLFSTIKNSLETTTDTIGGVNEAMGDRGLLIRSKEFIVGIAIIAVR
jgi:hypothetical protein